MLGIFSYLAELLIFLYRKQLGLKDRTEIKITLKREEIESTKQSYVKEVIAKKKPVTETQSVTGEITNEKIT